MAGYITYWPKDHLKQLQKENDVGPITVIYGCIHTSMPSIKSVKVGDVIYPVTLMDGGFYVLARLPVERIVPAYEYTLETLGNLYGALIPEDIQREHLFEECEESKLKPHQCHQRPFNCCSQTAALSEHGSTIQLRLLPKEKILDMRFGPTKSKQIPLRLDKNGNISIVSVSSNVRKMSDETQQIFEEAFH